MKHLATALTLLLLAAATPVGSQETTAAAPPDGSAPAEATAIKFGMDAGAIGPLTTAGAAPDYATLWIGPWTLTSGWGGPDGQLTAMRNANVTPAIHFYYWGDDISPTCVENGCWSNLHNAQKDRAGWEKLATQLTDHLNSKMGGKPAVVLLESEFNKGGISTYEPFDGYMAAMADKIHAAYPNAIIVLGFGNWDSPRWGNFDRAADASDMVGVQGMRGSTRQAQVDMYTLYDGLLTGVKALETKFPGAPIMLTDVAVSSYPEPDYATVQAEVLGEVFANLGELKAHGVEAMVYRSWKDSPNMDTKNYYGEAERHWGMAWAANATQKAAGKVWIEGVKAERTSATPPPPPPPQNLAPSASFTATSTGLQATVDATASTDPDGDALSYSWSFGDGSTATGRTAGHAYAGSGTYTISLAVSDGALGASTTRGLTVVKPFTATMAPGPGASEYWVEAKVNASATPAKVEVKAGDGAWTALRLRSTSASATTWGESLQVAKGTAVSFRATDAHGQTVTSAAKPWLGPASSTTTTSASTSTTASQTATTSASSSSSSAPMTFKATFSPKATGNDWWVESGVSANQGVTKVEAKVNAGAWTVLPKTDWGTYAKSVKAPDGSKVTFRATNASGVTSTSAAYTW